MFRSPSPSHVSPSHVSPSQGSPSHAPPARAAKPSRGSRRTAAAAALAVAASLTVPAAPAAAAPATVPAHPRLPTKQPVKQAVATGYGGAVSTVDPDASRTALEVLRRGGNAMDAAVAAGATLGVTEPYVAAIGGGGYMTYYDARTRRVHALDGREFAPKRMKQDAFIDPATGRPLPFDQAVTSGLGVGVPGTLAQWDLALRRFGTRDLGTLLRPAIKVADRGFVVDQEFHDQTATNEARFRDIVPTRRLFLPGGKVPAVGSVFRNPDLADTYRELARRGTDWFYQGGLGKEIARTVAKPRWTRRRRATSVPASWSAVTSPPTGPCRASQPTCPTGGRTCTACRPRRPAGPPWGRRSTSSATSAWTRATRSRPSTTTWRRPSSPTPTAAATSATPTRWTCPWTSCCRPGSPASARA